MLPPGPPALSMRDVPMPDGWVRLPLSSWALRIIRGVENQPAIEVYSGRQFVDVAVARTADKLILRGARRGVQKGAPWALAWGELPDSKSKPDVVFRAGRWPRRDFSAGIMTVEEAFWVAEVTGKFSAINVAADGERIVGHRLLREPGWTRWAGSW